MSQTQAARAIEAFMRTSPWTLTPVFWADVPYDVNDDDSVLAHSYNGHTAASLRDQDGVAGSGFIVGALYEVGRPSGELLSGSADLGSGSVEIIREFRLLRLEWRILTPADHNDTTTDAIMQALEDLWRHRVLKITGDAAFSLRNFPLSEGGDLFRQSWDRFVEEDWRRDQLDVFLLQQDIRERPTVATTVTVAA